MPSRGIAGIYLEKDGKTYKSPMKGPKQALVFGTVIAPARIVIEATRLPISIIYGVGHRVKSGIRMISTPKKVPVLSKTPTPKAIGPKAIGPKATGPKVTGPKVTEPKINESIYVDID